MHITWHDDNLLVITDITALDNLLSGLYSVNVPFIFDIMSGDKALTVYTRVPVHQGHHTEQKLTSNAEETTARSTTFHMGNIKAERYVDIFKNIGNRFIIGGDFNAKHTHWGSGLITTKGRELLKAIN
jgi:hypothetical protein